MNIRTLLLAFLLFLVTAACGTVAPTYNQEMKPVDLDVQVVDEDDAITQAVRRGIEDAQSISAEDLFVKTNEGVVTLAGTVDHLLARHRAAQIAQTVKGVRAVINRLIVLPSERSNAAIKTDVDLALATDPITEAWQITSFVEEGVVTLTGTVDSWQEKQLAGRVISGVQGVTEVRNDLAIAVETTRSDPEIREDVVHALQWDARVDEGLIDVKVENRHVVLSGAVGSAYESMLVLSDAWVRGVEHVDATDLEIKWRARDKMKRTAWASSRTDADIQAAVKDAFAYDPRVASFNVDVTVEAGTATLTGVVDNLKAKQAAAQDAHNTAGVWYVRNLLSVSFDNPLSDAALTEAARVRLRLDPFVSQYEVFVTVQEGVVELSGTVDSHFERRQAEDVVSHVKGVVAIRNNLKVST